MANIFKYCVSGLFVLAMSVGVVAVTQQDEQANPPQDQAAVPNELPIQPPKDNVQKTWFDVAMQVDGLVMGTIIGIDPETQERIRLANMNVVIARDGAVAGRARTDDAGRFQVAGLEPGIYTVLVAGSSDEDGPTSDLRGFAAFSIQVWPNRIVAQADDDAPVQFASMQQGGGTFTVAVAPRSIFPLLMELAGETGLTPVAAPAAGAPGAGLGAAGAGGGAAAAGGAFPFAGFAPPGGGSSAPGFAGGFAPSAATPTSTTAP